ncbi:MAG: hypothetical protein DWQ29_14300 [Planctomycetota bacterium]|nr:MAG: hypothetical protein DWQ29_14300 [Planctomycetota bacterium]
MATTTRPETTSRQPADEGGFLDAPGDAVPGTYSVSEPVRRALKPLASLKLTVVLFALSIFIVLAGTLAQVEKDIWDVINEYFRVDFAHVTQQSFPWINFGAFFTWIDVQLFFPVSFFPSRPDLPDWLGFPFPKGWLIGAVMMLNLFAAHTVRFKVQASGMRLLMGCGVLVLGAIVTTLVIAGGSGAGGFTGDTLISYGMLWKLMQLSLLALLAGCVYGVVALSRERSGLRWLLGICGALLAVALYFSWAYASGIDDSSMRILYQLVKGTLAGLVLLAGCVMVFRKRAGIVLLHGGIGLMMVSEVVVGVQATEARMQIEEGQSSNFVEDINTSELAFVTDADEGEQRHIVVPERLLKAGETISSDELPVDVEVLQFMRNSDIVPLRRAPDGLENPATAGVGTANVAVEKKPVTGMESEVNLPSAYVTLREKETGRELGTYLVSAALDMFDLDWNYQTVNVDGVEYKLNLRFERSYKPYVVTLKNVEKEDYIGTDTPRDYSSYISLKDESRGEERSTIHIWMNNPLRYAGETFYQSSYTPANAVYEGSKEWTSLQVVKNSGWMIPYVGCMIVLVGMCAQFCLTLLRFLQRRTREAEQAAIPAAAEEFRKESNKARKRRASRESTGIEIPDHLGGGSIALGALIAPAVVVTLAAAFLLHKAQPAESKKGELDLAAFGRVPVVDDGRPKPIDTLARNSLLQISDAQSFRGRMDERTLKKNWPEIREEIADEWDEVDVDDLSDFEGRLADLPEVAAVIEDLTGADRQAIEDQIYQATSEKLPAVRWLLDVIAAPQVAMQHRVFKIESLELQATLGLPRRQRFRYAYEEFEPGLKAFFEELAEAGRVREEEGDEALSAYQRKLVEFRQKLGVQEELLKAFSIPNLPDIPTPEELESNPARVEQFRGDLMAALAESDRLEAEGLPLSVPVATEREESDEERTAQWFPYSTAMMRAFLQAQIMGERPPKPTLSVHEIILAYAEGEPEAFNDAVKDHQKLIAGMNLPDLNLNKIDREAYFNHTAPFYWCAVLYVFGFILTAASWLGFRRPLGWSAFALMALTFLVHTIAIIARIYISGRPPVTNLYSSAVFIGWAAVLLGLGLEVVYRLGVGNVIASVAGFITLGIAHLLAGDGDTFTVLQAVLDTQFWLATHVVTVTLGYATTYVAGLLGLSYLIGNAPPRHIIAQTLLWTPVGCWLLPDFLAHQFGIPGFVTLTFLLLIGVGIIAGVVLVERRIGFARTSLLVSKNLTRMTYGALCFSILFSFVGTVLGGLWADDSWGRFWGWDPKENGALIIVLWNALVLHARWGGMVKDRGLAVLAVLGNICVSWSWFGVNELGVGLHSYGFTEGVLMVLGLYCLSQLLIAGMGCVPKDLWWSHTARKAGAEGGSA